MKNSIVIFTNGEICSETITHIARILCEDTGDTRPQIHLLDQRDIARMLARDVIIAQQKPKQSTEEGDHAVSVICTMIPTESRSSQAKLEAYLWRMLAISEHHIDSDAAGAFIKAMSVIAQNASVSKEYAEKYNYTKTIQKAVATVYNEYKNQ